MCGMVYGEGDGGSVKGDGGRKVVVVAVVRWVCERTRGEGW